MKHSRTYPFKTITFLLLVLILTSCTTQNESALPAEAPLPVEPPSTAMQENLSPEPVETIPTSISNTLESVPEHPAPELGIKETFASLPPGGYILYSNSNGMSTISVDGTFQQKISDSLEGVPISADGRILAAVNRTNENDNSGYINLLTGEIKNTGQSGAISPDLKWVVKTNQCDPAVDQLGIEGFSTKANISFCTYVDELKIIKTDKVNELVSQFKWSPNASKFAFTKITTGISDESNGDWTLLLSNALFVTDASCFQDPRTCDKKTSLSVFNPYKITNKTTNELYLNWSPDGTFVVLNNGIIFVVFDLRNEMAWKLEKSPVYLENNPQYFGISPDNEWIAYSGDWTNIMLQPLKGGEPIEIANNMEDVQVLGWIMAPLLETNGTFKVLPDGNHARVYAQPGFERQQTGTLYANNTFGVLDGPVQEDGYTWWYIHSDVDDTEGWVTEFYGWYEIVD